MNCQQVQDLMPLYAGGELEENRARSVTAHMQVCEMCSGSTREYRETRQLLQGFVPPAFTEDFYAEMRRNVWQEIEKKPVGPAFFGIVADLFRPRLAWAAATAVLIVVSVIGIYVISRRAWAPQPVVSQPPASTTPNEQLLTSPNNKSSASSLASSGNNSSRTGVHQPDERHKRKTISDRAGVAVMPTVATVSPVATSATVPGDSRQLNREVSDASGPPLRVEIQTKNPNIRIIWFAPRDTKQVSPNSKGI